MSGRTGVRWLVISVFETGEGALSRQVQPALQSVPKISSSKPSFPKLFSVTHESLLILISILFF